VHKDYYNTLTQYLVRCPAFIGGVCFPHGLQLSNVCFIKQTKQLDGNLPSELEEFLNNNQGVEMLVKLGTENTTLASDSFTKDQEPYPSAETRGATVVVTSLLFFFLFSDSYFFMLSQ
jgi:hypothetical protein